jgi:ABC-2 type transport system ATP-binding protein
VENVLSIRGLTKRYRRIVAVDNLDLEIPSGTICGILGPNGSGKTTTLGMVLSVIHPSAGSYQWFGKQPDTEVRKRIGAILEAPLFYPYLSGLNNLRVVAKIKGVEESAIHRKLDLVGLSERKDSPFQTYSLGMKQRLAIAAAMLSDPDVLILDEPTNGLDPQGIHDIRALIKQIGGTGVTVILASHLLDEVEKVCSHVAVLKQGKLLYNGTVDGISGRKPRVEVGSEDLDALKSALEGYPGVESIQRSGEHLLVSFSQTPDNAHLNRMMFDKGITLNRIATRNVSLEEQFLEITKGKA